MECYSRVWGLLYSVRIHKFRMRIAQNNFGLRGLANLSPVRHTLTRVPWHKSFDEMRRLKKRLSDFKGAHSFHVDSGVPPFLLLVCKVESIVHALVDDYFSLYLKSSLARKLYSMEHVVSISTLCQLTSLANTIELRGEIPHSRY